MVTAGVLQTAAIAILPLSAIAQTAPNRGTEVVSARIRSIETGYEIVLLTPAPEKLRLISTQNGRVFKAIIQNGYLSQKFRMSDGQYIHVGNPAKGLEVLKVRQLARNQLQICTFSASAQGNLTLDRAFQRADTFVLRVKYNPAQAGKPDPSFCKN